MGKFYKDDDGTGFISHMTEKYKRKELERLNINNHIEKYDKLTDEEMVALRKRFREETGSRASAQKKHLMELGINEPIAEMIILETNKEMYTEYIIKSRYDECFGIRFPVGLKEKVLLEFDKLRETLHTRPTPEECVEYFETVGVEVKVIPSEFKF